MKKRSWCAMGMMLVLIFSVQSYGAGITLSPTHGGSVSKITGTVYSQYYTGNFGAGDMYAVSVMKFPLAGVTNVSAATLTNAITYSVPATGGFITHYFVLEHYTTDNSTSLAKVDATTTDVERVTGSFSSSGASVIELSNGVIQVGYPSATLTWDVASCVAADHQAGFTCSSFRIVETDADGNYISTYSSALYGMQFGSPALTVASLSNPAFSPAGPYIPGSTEVEITCATEGASIYYTTTGTNPTTSSDEYLVPVTVNDGTTLKAIAVVDGCASEVTSQTYNVLSDFSCPVYGGSVSKNTGTVYSDYYTGNYGVSNMNAVSVMKFPLNHKAMVSAATLTNSVNYSVPDGGGFATHYFVLEHYTTDNSTSLAQVDATTADVERVTGSFSTSGSSIVELSNGVIQVGYPSATLTWDVTSYVAADRLAGFACSSFRIVETDVDGNYATYSVALNGMLFNSSANVPSLVVTQVLTPVFTPEGPVISGPTAVTITCGTAGATIYYTTDGNDPTTASDEYAGAVGVNGGTTLKAIAVVDGVASGVTSQTYTVPDYNRPVSIVSGSAVVDGNLSDWAGSAWASIDQPYDITGSTEADLNTDIPEAYYAAKWQAGKVYVAVKVRDTAHHFTNEYDGWNTRDAVEIFLHTDGGDPTDYAYCTSAQQYIVGIKNSDHTKVWAYIGGAGAVYPVPDDGSFDSIGKAAASIDGEWLYYEVEMTPFTYFSQIVDGNMTNTVPTTLELGDIVGVDVCVDGHDGTSYTGTKSENTQAPKFSDWGAMGLHKLVAAVVPGDANLDGAVDVGDLGILAANYGTTMGAGWDQGDFTGDGAVDVGDLGVLAANYGSGTSGANWDADYAKVFGASVSEDAEEDNTLCSTLGLPLIAGLALMGLMLVKLEE